MVMRLFCLLLSILVWPIDFLAQVRRRLSLAYYEHRRPPWLDIGPCDPLSDDAGEHNVTFVSRHDIAECGLKCQKCHKNAVDRGDFKPVRRTRLGEAVVCPGCDDILVAAPDTEHGDDLLPYDKKAFHRFVRISELDALREQYGPDMAGEGRSLAANEKRFKMPEQVALDPEKAVLAAGIPWSEVESNPYEPEGPQAVHITEPHPKE